MKKNILIFALGLIIGLGSAYYLNIKPDQNQKSKNDSMTNAGKNFSDEMNSYIRLQDADEKYRKADEILGKMMTLFLANISIHFDPKVKTYFDKTVGERTGSITDNSPKYRDVEKSKMAHEIPAPKEDEKDERIYTVMDIPINKITNEEFRGPFVKTRHQVINNSFMYYKNAKLSLDKKVADDLSGVFSGIIHILAGQDKGYEYDVALNINFQIAGDYIAGTYLSELSKEGKQISYHRGTGKNNHIKQAGNKNEYLLSTSPNSYMQLFKRDANQFYGSFYKNDEYVGVVIINRN